MANSLIKKRVFWEEDEYGFNAPDPQSLLQAIGGAMVGIGRIEITEPIEITEKDGRHIARWKAKTPQTETKAERLKALADILNDDR